MAIPEIVVTNTYYQENSEPKSFQWTKQWYPVAVTEYLEPTQPHAIELLGKKLVLWRDSREQWHCFEDACPHRLVPLSQGRIEPDDTLLCSYHAWRFNGEGECISIPQSINQETENRNCSNNKACAVVYPLQERQGLIWVWGESGKDAWQESQQLSPAIIPELEEKSDHAKQRIMPLPLNIRDLPYGWDYFIENVTDPAHVPVSHHGLMGSRYSDAKYYDMLPERKISTQEGFSFSVTSTSPLIESSITDFQPPSHVRIVTSFADGGKLILALYVIPTRPGWCRHIGRQVLVKNNQGKTPPGLAFFALPMPKWLGHVLASLFLHQDMVFLHYQEKYIEAMEGNWLEKVYTPNPQDKMVITFRQWLKYRAGGKIPWFGKDTLESGKSDSKQLFDVYHTHTKNCRYCQKALTRIKLFTTLSYAIAVVLGIIGIWLDLRHLLLEVAKSSVLVDGTLSLFLPSISVGILFLLALIFVGIGFGLRKFTRLFYVYEFNHFDND